MQAVNNVHKGGCLRSVTQLLTTSRYKTPSECSVQRGWCWLIHMAASGVDYVIINVRRNLVEFTLAQDCECCRLSSSASTDSRHRVEWVSFTAENIILYYRCRAFRFLLCARWIVRCHSDQLAATGWSSWTETGRVSAKQSGIQMKSSCVLWRKCHFSAKSEQFLLRIDSLLSEVKLIIGSICLVY